MLRKKVSMHGVVAGSIILAATLLRLVLVSLGWPLTNSDEGTIGLMALHIAYQGVHPTFFYGQHYMGSWEAFLGAGIFHLIGPSLFAVRLGTVSMFALFLLSMYLLTRLVFSRTWALITLLLVGTGSGFVMAQELRAIGGYSETLFFSALLFLCAAWLALTYKQGRPAQRQDWRWLIYLGWGLTAGLSLWSDLLILPVVCASGLLILIICWRELLRLAPLLCLLGGIVCGAAPLLYYNLHAAPGQDSLKILEALHGGQGVPIYTWPAILTEIHGTFQVSLPMMTGEPFCPVTELSFLGPNSPDTLSCSLAHGGWSLSYLLLFSISGVLAGWGIWRMWQKRKLLENSLALQNELRLQLARFLLLLGAAMSLGLYTFSTAPQHWPGISARYLICLLVATPAVFWPLWQGLQSFRTRKNFAQRAFQVFCAAVLLCFCGLGLVGSALAFTEVPAAVAMNQSDAGLIQELSRLGVTHIYGGYWTCNKIAFESDEHIVCAVINTHMQIDYAPNHNRYSPYIHEVQADQQAAYVLSTDPEQFSDSAVKNPLIDPEASIYDLPDPFRTNYTRIVIDGYIIYLPKH